MKNLSLKIKPLDKIIYETDSKMGGGEGKGGAGGEWVN